MQQKPFNIWECIAGAGTLVLILGMFGPDYAEDKPEELDWDRHETLQPDDQVRDVRLRDSI